MADGSTQGNGSTDPRYGPGSTSAPDSGTGPGSTTSGGGPGGSTSPSLGPGSTTSGSPGSGGSTSGDGSTSSPASTTAPHLSGNGNEIFNHPSTDRATASLLKKYASGSAAGRVESSAHQAELNKFKAEANTAYKQGQKAYHRVREQAADSGVNLAAYSDRGRSQAQKNASKPQAQ